MASLTWRVTTLYVAGGLGNQLFDYAAARSLCDRRHANLVIDSSNLDERETGSHSRALLLDRFPVRAEFRTPAWVGQKAGIASRLMRRLREDVGASLFERSRTEHGYFEEFWALGPRVILRSHFLRPRFFLWNRQNILKDLSPLPISSQRLGVYEEPHRRIARSDCSVAIHIRRGDYLDAANAWLKLENHDGTVLRNMERLRSELSRPDFFVFSDDSAHCSRLFCGMRDVVLVSTPESDQCDAFVEFSLMRMCRHFMISNSSFSWWAAFLGGNSGRVLMPQRFDRDGIMDLDEFRMPGWELMD